MRAESKIDELKNDQAAMAALGAASGITSPLQSARFFGASATEVVRLMQEHATSPDGLESLVTAASALSWTEREHPEQLFRADQEAHSEDIARTTLGRSLDDLVQKLATAANITPAQSARFVDATTSSVLACLAGDPNQEVRPEVFLPAGHQPTDALHATPTQAAAPGSARPAVAPSPSSSATSAAADQTGSGKRGLLLAAGAAALAILAIFGVTALSGGSEADPVTGPTDVATTDATPSEQTVPTTPTATSAAPATTAAPPVDTTAENEPTDAPGSGPEIVTLSVPMRDIENINGEAEGTLTFDFNTVTGDVCYEIESINIDGPYRSHIHVGTADEKGGIVVDLGPQQSGATGCVENLPVDTNAILANPSGHYAELHDVTEEFTIRGQLSEAIETGNDSPDAVVDTDGGGASILLDSGTIYLEGEVPSQAIADELAGSLSDIGGETPVVNNLEVVEGAPLPSGRVVIADAVFFDVGSSAVKSIDDETLEAITALAASRPDWVLTVVGHTDSVGSDVSNLELSLARATALRDLLAAQGIADENLRVRGAGETAPIGDNATDEGRAQNRRIEFEFTPN